VNCKAPGGIGTPTGREGTDEFITGYARAARPAPGNGHGSGCAGEVPIRRSSDFTASMIFKFACINLNVAIGPVI